MKEVEKYFNKGQEKYNQKKYEEAIKCFDQVIELDPKYTEAYSQRGYIKNKLKKYKAAIDDFTQAIKLDPKNAEFYYRRGYSKNRIEQYEMAIEDFKIAISNHTDHVKAYKNMGVANNYLKQYKLAKENFNKTIELDSNYVEAYTGRGYAKNGLEEYDAAIIDFNTALDLIESNPKLIEELIEKKKTYKAIVYSNRGYSKRGQKNYKEAISDLDIATDKLDPNYPQAYYYKSLVYRDMGDEEKANAILRKAVTLDPHLIFRKESRGATENLKKKIEQLEQKTLETENFQDTLEKLKESFDRGRKRWLIASISMAIFTTIVFTIPFFKEWISVISIPNKFAIGSYSLFLFLSIVTFSCFRLYATARRHTMEIENRLSMSKLLVWVEETEIKDKVHYQNHFYPKIADVIVTPLYPAKIKKDDDSNNANYLLQEIGMQTIMDRTHKPPL